MFENIMSIHDDRISDNLPISGGVVDVRGRGGGGRGLDM